MIPLTQKPFEKHLAIHLDCERQAAIWFYPAPGTCWRQWNHRVLAMLVWIEILKEWWLETLTFPEVINNSDFFFVGETRTWFFSQSGVKPGLVKSQHLLQEISKDLPMSQHLLGFQTLPIFLEEISTSPTAAPLWRSPSDEFMAADVASGCLKFKVILNGKS